MRKRKSKPTRPRVELEMDGQRHEIVQTNAKAVQLRRKQKAARLMGYGASRERTCHVLQQSEEMSYPAARELYYEVLREWQEDYRAEAPFHRAAAIQRITNDLATMRAERTDKNLAGHIKRAGWNDITRAEREIARLTGAYAPTEVRVLDVDEQQRDTLIEVVDDMFETGDHKSILANGIGLEDPV